MELFKGPRTFRVIVRKCKGSNEAVEGRELSRKKTVAFDLDVPVVAAIKDKLPDVIQKFLNSRDGGQDLKLKVMTLDFSQKSSVRFINLDSGKDMAVCGFDTGSQPCTLSVRKFFFVDEAEMMNISLSTEFTDELWVIGGTYLGDGEMKLKIVPFQGELKLDADTAAAKEDEDDGAGDDPGEKLAKKKAGKKSKPVAEEVEAAQV